MAGWLLVCLLCAGKTVCLTNVRGILQFDLHYVVNSDESEYARRVCVFEGWGLPTTKGLMNSDLLLK